MSSTFSADGSDWQQTDVEDQRSNNSQSRGSEHVKTSQPGKNEKNPGNPPLMPAGGELSPIYIINNTVLMQVREVQPQTVRLGIHTSPDKLYVER